jgi:type I restriction enzyme M protein
MSTPARPEDIRSAVWAACDTFRGAVDADQYKNYVLAFLFLKYISDVWKSHAVKHRERLKNSPAETRELRLARMMERERFKLKQFEGRAPGGGVGGC